MAIELPALNGAPTGWRRTARAALPMVLLVLAWVLLVSVGLIHHEFWRDEVRALSSATEPRHVWNLPADNLGESHPLAWYVLLRLAHDVWPVKEVLPGVSVLCAAVALAIFLARAPFPMWWKALFVLGGLPLYEYVVMARNYGISMLLMFAFAALLCRPRRSAVHLGAVLFVLAQTNVHAALLVPLLTLPWIALWAAERQDAAPAQPGAAELALGLALAAAGLVGCALAIYPSKHSLITAHLGMVKAYSSQYLGGTALAWFEPGYYFRKLTLLPALPGTLLLLAGVAGLARRPVFAAAALLGLWALALFFALIYNGGYRHQGLWFIFLVSLYWIHLGHPLPAGPATAACWQARLLPIGLYGVLPLLLLIQCVSAYQSLRNDVLNELSKSRALGAAVRADPTLRGAVVLAQPDELLEVLPYYLDNPAWKIREGGFGNTPTQSLDIRRQVSMGDLLQLVQRFKASTGRPVLFVTMFRWQDGSATQTFHAGWGLDFTVSPAELQAFRQASTRLQLGPDAVEENFDAYVFR